MTASRPRRRPWGFVFLLLFVAAGVAGGWAWQQYRSFSERPLGATDAVSLQIESGDGFRQILRRIREAGIDAGHDLAWQLLAREMGVMTRLQVGEYALTADLTPRELLRRIARGEVVQYRFTIVEGWSFRELRAALAANALVTQSLGELSDEDLMRELGKPGVHPEGRFLPETYQFTRGARDIDLLRRANEAMDAALQQAWEGRSADLPLQSADEALILASIIEKETGVAGERREIAGVFTRRLQLGMKLQTDPTVIYGIGAEFDGNLTRAHLTTDTPWNTYVHAGLPPTPIALPGRAALQAAVDPMPGDTLYFVARGDGSHQFSRTLDEHNRAVRQYQLGQP